MAINIYNENYLYKEQNYTFRAEFYFESDHETTHTQFISSRTHGVSHPEPLSFAIHRFLVARLSIQSPLYLLYSGGIDSEIILYTALKHGIPIIPVVVDLFGMNSYELGYAKRFFNEFGVKNYLWIEISEMEFQKKWLPELIRDIESLSFILSGAYIGARSCPKGATVIYSGENPNVVCADSGELFFIRHEYSFWANKVSKRHGVSLHELFVDHDVLHAYFNYPAIRERLVSPVPFSEWFADHEYLGKEYFYADRDFMQLKRRYAQHGWEVRKNTFTYSKGMASFMNSSAEPRHLLKPEFALPFLLECLKGRPLDYDLAWRALFEDYLIPGYVPFGKNGLRPQDFNKYFFVYYGSIKNQNYNFPEVERTSTVRTSHKGERLDVSTG